ncbi:unnamed protein product, partial [Effrenium voratum]
RSRPADSGCGEIRDCALGGRGGRGWHHQAGQNAAAQASASQSPPLEAQPQHRSLKLLLRDAGQGAALGFRLSMLGSELLRLQWHQLPRECAGGASGGAGGGAGEPDRAPGDEV